MPKLILLSLIFLFLVIPFTAGAVEFRSPITADTLNSVLDLIIKISLSVILPLATIAVIVAAFFILKSEGIPQKAQKGKQILTYALIGLAIVIVGAGSGTLLKTVFKSQLLHTEEIPGVTYKIPADYGLPMWPLEKVLFWANTIQEEIDNLTNELSDAQQKGNTDLSDFLFKRIQNLMEQKMSLTLWGEELIKMANEDAETSADVQRWKRFFDSNAGLTFLLKNGAKADKEGWYKMGEDGIYNPQTGEFIDKSGETYTDTTLYGDGSIMFCKPK